MLNKKLEKAINDQINYELYSGYIYLAMAAYFSDLNLPGCANWMRVQEEEEKFHAMKFFDYVTERGGRVELKAIEGPQTTWKSPLDAFETALHHEETVTTRINNLVDLAIKEKDHASNNFLQWYVSEQVEEEANVTAIIQKLKLAGKDGAALFMIDQELATRVFTPPTAAA